MSESKQGNGRSDGNSVFQQAERESPFVLKRAYKEEDLHYSKYELDLADNTKRKVKVTTTDMGNREICIHSLHEFNSIANKYEFTAANKFLYFRETLRGVALDSWDVALTTTEDRNDAAFLTCISAFLLTLFTAESFENLVMYLTLVKKPRWMTAQQLMVRFRTLISYGLLLPEADPNRVQVQQQKKMFLDMQPDYSRTQFRANKSIAEMTLPQMAQYFTILEQSLLSLRLVRNPSSNGNGKGNDKDGGGYRGRRRSNGKYERSRYRKDKDSDKKGKVGRGPDDWCPLHQYLTAEGKKNHKWKDCMHNPRSQNYRGDSNQNPRNRNYQGSSGHNGGGYDAHHSSYHLDGGAGSQQG